MLSTSFSEATPSACSSDGTELRSNYLPIQRTPPFWLYSKRHAETSLKCEVCTEEVGHPVETGRLHFLPTAELDFADGRYRNLFLSTVSRIQKAGLPVKSVSRVKLRKRGTLQGLVGLTTFSVEGYQMNQKEEFKPKGRHEITFYSSFLDRLSEDAVVAVMAHELAHVWLNEHVGPEASKQREEDADLLAEMWGFQSEMRALERETEPI
jgi:hypothetical protein